MNNKIDELYATLTSKEKVLRAYKGVATFLTTLVITMVIIKSSMGGGMGAFGMLGILLFVIDIPFLFLAFKTNRECNEIKTEIELLKKNDDTTANYSERKEMLVKFNNIGVRFLISPIVLIVCLVCYISSKEAFWLLMALLAIVDIVTYFVKYKKISSELAEKGGLTPEEAALSKNQFKKSLKTVGIIAALIVALLIVVSMATSKPSKSRYEEVFEKDPNEWTEEDEEYVNDLFEWIDEKDKD